MLAFRTKAAQRRGTFGDFKLPPKTDPKDCASMVAGLRSAARDYKDERFQYYLDLMRKRSRLANDLPWFTAALGVIGLFLASGVIVVRTLHVGKVITWENGDLVVAAGAVIAYTLMSALLLYERLNEGSGGYFRAVGTVVAIRDLWTAYQFADISREVLPKKQEALEEIERWQTPIKEFCAALDAIIANELVAWQTAYQATSKLRDDTANQGLKAALDELRTLAQTAEQAAKAASGKADEAKEAADRAKTPASIDLSLGAAKTVGIAVVSVDGERAASGENQRSFGISGIRQGIHTIRVEFTPKTAPAQVSTYEKLVDLHGGVNAVTIEVA